MRPATDRPSETLRVFVLGVMFLAASAHGCDDSIPAHPNLVDDGGGEAGGSASCRTDGTVPYPAGPCGGNEGDVIAAYAFDGRLQGVKSAERATLKLSDLYDPDGKKPHRLLFVTVSALWCVACKAEAPDFPALRAAYEPRGVYIVTDIAEDNAKKAATQHDVDVWTTAFKLDTAVVNDPEFVFQNFFDKSTMPLNLIVDLRTMKIVAKFPGSDLPRVRSTFDKLLAGA